MSQELLSWLTDADKWLHYRAHIDIGRVSPDHPAAIASRNTLLSDKQVVTLVDEVKSLPWVPLKRHNDANHPLHKLAFLAEIGVRADDLGLTTLTQWLISERAKDGLFQVPLFISKSYGGDDEERRAWALCDTPLLTWTLIAMGCRGEETDMAVARLIEMGDETGWGCKVSDKLGKFRGPGRKSDPCPYATLLMLRLLGSVSEYKDSEASKRGAEALLSLWERRKEHKAYLFGMGTDFRRLKAPLIWYDLLNVLDVLSHFDWLKGDERLGQMLQVLEEKRDASGHFTPDSIWMAWKGWEFCQKKEPSRWITLLAQRILDRLK